MGSRIKVTDVCLVRAPEEKNRGAAGGKKKINS